MPANGLFQCEVVSDNTNASLCISRTDIDVHQYALITNAGRNGTLEISVRKGEHLKIGIERCHIIEATFYYCCGNAPKDEEEQD